MKRMIILALLASSPVAAQTVESGAASQAIAIVGGGGGGSQRVHTTPDAIAPAIYPSAPCIAVYSGGVSVTGFGAAIGGGITDQVCQGGNLAATAAGVAQMTGSLRAAQIADEALQMAFDLYRSEVQPAEPQPPRRGELPGRD